MSQSSDRPKAAMILAAGLGKRMQPITASLPKPLVEVAGRPLIDHALDRLAAAGVEKAVINVHYLADQLQSYLAGRKSPRVVISDERSLLLDTGGGIAKALPQLGEEPFFVLNSDSFWIEGPRPNLAWLTQGWHDARMDGLLLLAPTVAAVGYSGPGDFVMDPSGRLSRRKERHIAPFVYSGAALFHPRLFAGVPSGPFSLNVLFDRAIEAGRLFGVRMDGIWLHVGSPEAIRAAETSIAESAA